MFNLYKTGDDSYTIRYASGMQLHGSKLTIIAWLFKCEVEESEIFHGFNALDMGDTFANYGVNQMFIYSSKVAS